jgi:hypothetical protein
MAASTIIPKVSLGRMGWLNEMARGQTVLVGMKGVNEAMRNKSKYGIVDTICE